MNIFVASTIDQTKNLHPLLAYFLYSPNTALRI